MIEHQVKTKVRVYDPPSEASGHWRDFDATKIDIAPDGSMILTRIAPSGQSRLNPVSGKMEEAVEVRILAVIGPDGRLRAETVETEE